MKKVSYIGAMNFALGLVMTIIISFLMELTWGQNTWEIVGIFILSYPWRNGKDIYSIFGGINRSGNIYSLCPLFQNAEGNAYGLLGISLFQNAKNNAEILLGLSLFQKAGHNASTYVGISLFQIAKNNAEIGLGLSLFQNAKNNVNMSIGISLCQIAKNNAEIGMGVSLFQYRKK